MSPTISASRRARSAAKLRYATSGANNDKRVSIIDACQPMSMRGIQQDAGTTHWLSCLMQFASELSESMAAPKAGDQPALANSGS
jgi:hypothetical protein